MTEKGKIKPSIPMRNTTSKAGSSKNPESKETGSMNNDLHELFLEELADLLNAETQLTEALPKMAESADSPELAEAFKAHLQETKGHVTRLEQVFQSLDEDPEQKTCKAMQGLIEEGEELIEEEEGSSALDAGLIAAAQKVEHYEIASYGTVCSWAEQMGHARAAELLQQTLDEEKAADEKLTEIAETIANVKQTDTDQRKK